ncbi:MAG: CpsD/CapB family tyrosine-protein kinase [Desulfomonilaceae bacterium]
MIRTFASSYSDQLHRLHWALFPSEFADKSRVIQMTAARSSEGVTTVTLALASSMARLFGPDSTLVIEANLRKPAFHKILGGFSRTSILSVLENDETAVEAVTRLQDTGFSIISAGSIALESEAQGPEFYLEKMAKVVERLKPHYKYILIDSPPIVPYIDSDIIAGAVDGIVIVVEANSTRAEVLDFAISRLKSVDAPIVGLILNKRVFHIPKWLYRFL